MRCQANGQVGLIHYLFTQGVGEGDLGGGDEIELIYVEDGSVIRENPSDLNARITLRLPEDLKSRIENAATQEGISLNSWLLKTSDRNSFSVSIGKRQLKGKGKS